VHITLTTVHNTLTFVHNKNGTHGQDTPSPHHMTHQTQSHTDMDTTSQQN